MCELLALSSAVAARLTFALHELASHGLPSGPNHDGWGVGFHDGADAMLFREPAAAGDSALVRHLESAGPAARIAISQIRRATRGPVALANTQPFLRELGGRAHLFAHNGDLPGIEQAATLPPGGFARIGQSDSELAFCLLLESLRPLWRNGDLPDVAARHQVLTSFAAHLRTLGPANFLYCDGDLLFAHGHRRTQRATGRIEPPGLWVLQRQCMPGEFDREPCSGVSISHDPAAQSAHPVTLVASVPLSSARWRPLDEGEMLMVRDGAILANPPGLSNTDARFRPEVADDADPRGVEPTDNLNRRTS